MLQFDVLPTWLYVFSPSVIIVSSAVSYCHKLITEMRPPLGQYYCILVIKCCITNPVCCQLFLCCINSVKKTNYLKKQQILLLCYAVYYWYTRCNGYVTNFRQSSYYLVGRLYMVPFLSNTNRLYVLSTCSTGSKGYGCNDTDISEVVGKSSTA